MRKGKAGQKKGTYTARQAIEEAAKLAPGAEQLYPRVVIRQSAPGKKGSKSTAFITLTNLLGDAKFTAAIPTTKLRSASGAPEKEWSVGRIVDPNLGDMAEVIERAMSTTAPGASLFEEAEQEEIGESSATRRPRPTPPPPLPSRAAAAASSSTAAVVLDSAGKEAEVPARLTTEALADLAHTGHSVALLTAREGTLEDALEAAAGASIVASILELDRKGELKVAQEVEITRPEGSAPLTKEKIKRITGDIMRARSEAAQRALSRRGKSLTRKQLREILRKHFGE